MSLRNFPIGISDFKEVIETESIFIDKTLFVKDIMENIAKVILITRPRRFGKTMNMSMLQRFLEIKGDPSLFDNLAIQGHSDFCKRHQNKYPVIFVSFKDVKFESFEEALSEIQEIFSKLYEQHRNLLEGDLLSAPQKESFDRIRYKTTKDSSDLTSALFDLISYVEKKHKISPILLLDEYDTPIHNAYTHHYYNQMINVMRAILGKALKDNSHLGKAVLTGIMKISQESLFSGLNNVEVHTVLDERYAPYFGFSEEEVVSLLPENMKIDPIRAWYNGYTIGGQQLYNPWSIINCLKNNDKLRPYWVNTSDNTLVFKVIENTQLEEAFQKLIEGEALTRPLTETLTFSYLEGNEDAVWTLLLHAGYLTVTSLEIDHIGRYVGSITIPNQEVMSIYVQMVEHWFSGGKKTSDYLLLISSLEHGDIKSFVKMLRDYIRTSGSYFDFGKNTPERVFHVFMLGLLVGLRDKYEIHSNREMGLGRCDLIFIPYDKTKKQIILEFKVCKTSEDLENTARTALTQIEDKQYAASQDNLKIGLAFCGKEVIAAVQENNAAIKYHNADEKEI